MVFEQAFFYLNLSFQLFVLDLLLSVDNAMVIAIACRSLPPKQRQWALLIGVGVAIVLRVLMTFLAGILLQVPWLRLSGGLALAVIGIKLIYDTHLIEETGPKNDVTVVEGEKSQTLWSAALTMVIADFVMSLDHVIGLAAIAQGNVVALAMGLALSVPFLMFGSQYLADFLQKRPELVKAGGAMLGWFAGDLAASDPVVSVWITLQSPALLWVIPLLVAVFVVLEAQVMADSRRLQGHTPNCEPSVATVELSTPPNQPK